MNFFNSLKRYGNNIALLDNKRQVTYDELDFLVKYFKNKLPIQKQLIAIEADISFNTIVAYLGALRGGHAVMMLDPAMPQDAKERILKAYKPNFLYSKKVLLPFYDKSHPLFSSLALLLSTSGSTGEVKFVRLSYENLQANCDSICAYLPLKDDDRSITSLPLSYSYALSVLNTHLQVGASLFLSNFSLMQKEFWKIFKTYKITNFNGVPYHYEMLRRLHFAQKEYSNLRFLTQAGGKLQTELVKYFAMYAKEQKKQFFVMYGQTEATARISYLPFEYALKKPSSIGIPIPKGKLYIKNNELIYEGKNVMLGYAKGLEELMLGDTLKGKLVTGDIAKKDKDGFFYIIGRKKRFIKMQGKRISLDMIEEYANNITPTVAIGEDDKLILVTTSKVEIAKIVAKHFNIFYKTIKQKIIDEFFYNKNGKIDYEKFKRIYL